MARARITKRFVDSVQPDPDRELYFFDTDLPGFGLRVKPNGRCLFFVEYRERWAPGRRKRRKVIGQHGRVNLQLARKKAQEMLASAQLGEDPAPPAALTVTFSEAAGRYIEEHARPKKKPSSVREDARLLNTKLLPALGKQNLQTIDRGVVARFHHQVSKAAPGSANRCLALLSKILNLCELWGLRPAGSNPCRYVQRNKERRIERYLSPDELVRLGTVLREESQAGRELPGVIRAVYLLLFTGARRGEILGLTWDMVDLENACFHLPDSKTGKKDILLHPFVVDLLRNTQRIKDNP